ncbi:Mrp/NBP35 family ATP-binding protein [Halanaerobiaceae bacterium Z-7014]|uniref:Iron-sulfur cluster carrier protein n=1 Tax=Halonatronomonas betaini TaxID=2778430 RepID=A0A931AU66_9FIRM|nr:Mrp/NBP35 family ATP-binding protein [Halonatronomonas betaini]MBF8436231.1 Mrp/NBP35 family ATP-binding protein [Halonatronomonas betaini]
MYDIEDGRIILNHGSIHEGLIAVASGKGGVGKSTVTVNLATALKERGKRVGIVDADIYGFNVPGILGLKDKPKAKSEEEIYPPDKNGIKVMSMASFVGDQSEAVIWRAPLLQSALKQFMEDVYWGELDYLLFDLPPGAGDMPLNIMQQFSDTSVLLVTTPQETATSVAGRVGQLAEQLDLDVLGLVNNMAYYQCSECGHKDYIFGKNGGRELADQLGIELLGEIPLQSQIRKLSDTGKPVIFEDPDHEISKIYLNIADQIIDNIKEIKV